MTAVAQHKATRIASIADEAYDAKQAGKYCLSLLLGLDGLSFSILDPARNKYLVLEAYAFQNVYSYPALCEQLSSLAKENAYLKQKFGKLQIAFDGTKSTLIPIPLFENSDKENFMKFNHSLGNDESTGVDHLKALAAKNLFALPHSLELKVKELFPGADIHHASSALIEGLLAGFKNQSGKRLFVHIASSHFEVVALEGASLLFYNSFRHQTSEDFIYYLLFVCEQLKLNPEKIELVLLGEVEKNSTIYDIVYKYIRNVKFGERPGGFTYSYKFSDIPSHFYYSLLSQARI